MNFSMNREDKRHPVTALFLPILAGSILALATFAFAQHHPSTGSMNSPHSSGANQLNEQQQAIKEKLTELRELQQEQRELQQEVIKNHPELKKQEDELRTLMQETLDDKLAARNVEIERLQTLQDTLKEGNMTNEEQSRLEAEFRQKVQKYKKAREETLNDPEVMEGRTALLKEIEKANPESAELGRKMQDLQQEIRQDFAETQK